jgi:hypothetical protein
MAVERFRCRANLLVRCCSFSSRPWSSAADPDLDVDALISRRPGRWPPLTVMPFAVPPKKPSPEFHAGVRVPCIGRSPPCGGNSLIHPVLVAPSGASNSGSGLRSSRTRLRWAALGGDAECTGPACSSGRIASAWRSVASVLQQEAFAPSTGVIECERVGASADDPRGA